MVNGTRRSRRVDSQNSEIQIIDNAISLDTNLLVVKINITLRVSRNSMEGGIALMISDHAGRIYEARCRSFEAGAEEDLEDGATSMTIQWAH